MKDEYQLVHELLKQRKIIYLNDILEHVPKDVLAKDLGLTIEQMEEYWSDPGDAFLEHMPMLAALLEIEELEIVNMVLRTVLRDGKK